MELKLSKARVFWKELCNNIFHDVVRYEGMKSWVTLMQNTNQLYCLFHREIERILHSHLPFQFSIWMPTKSSFLYFTVITMWRDLRERLLVLVIFLFSKKTRNKTKKIQSCESLLSINTSNHFKFIMTSTCVKITWSPTQEWNDDSYLQENQGL